MKCRSVSIIVMLLLLFVPAAQAQRSDVRLPAGAGTRAPVGGTIPATTDIRDSGFEGSYDTGTYLINDDWKVKSSHFVSPICKAGACGEDSMYAAPFEGSHWIYFGGTPEADTAFVEQKVIIPNTAHVQLTYAVWLSDNSIPSTMQIKVDSTVVYTLPTTETANYILRSVDLTPYADGKVHKIRFSYSKPGGGYADINIDSITLYKGESVPIFSEGFEDIVEGWIVKNATGDKVKCNTDSKSYSRSGDCAFMFKGSANEKSKLTQEFIFLRGLPDAPGGELRAPPRFAVYLGAFVKAPASVSGTLTLKLLLSDDSRLKKKVKLSGNGKYKWLQTPPGYYNGSLGIIGVLIAMKHTSAGGKTFVDDFEIYSVEDYD